MKKTNRILLLSIFGLTMTLALFLSEPVRSATDKTYQQIKLIVDILQYIENQYVDEPNQKSLIYGKLSL